MDFLFCMVNSLTAFEERDTKSCLSGGQKHKEIKMPETFNKFSLTSPSLSNELDAKTVPFLSNYQNCEIHVQVYRFFSIPYSLQNINKIIYLLGVSKSGRISNWNNSRTLSSKKSVEVFFTKLGHLVTWLDEKYLLVSWLVKTGVSWINYTISGAKFEADQEACRRKGV